MKLILCCWSVILIGSVLQMTCEASCCCKCVCKKKEPCCSCHSIVRPQKLPKVCPCKRRLCLKECPTPCTCTAAAPPADQCGCCSCTTSCVPSEVCSPCAPARPCGCVSSVDYQPFTLNRDCCESRGSDCGCRHDAEVDPVSLTLALNQRCCHTREDKLNFGACKLPAEGRAAEEPCCNVQEGGLYALNNRVMELRSQPCGCSRKSLADEALECYYAAEDYDRRCEDERRPALSYCDLGYAPERPCCAPFAPGAPQVDCQPCGEVLYNGPAECKHRTRYCCCC